MAKLQLEIPQRLLMRQQGKNLSEKQQKTNQRHKPIDSSGNTSKTISDSTNQMTSTNDPVNPNHYKDLGEYSAVHMVPKWGLGFELGNAIKYIQRAGKKPGSPEVEDLQKAIWYIKRRIHLIDPSEPDPAANRS